MNVQAAAAPDRLARLDEPVRRFLGHALAAGGPWYERVALRMRGRIRAGLWLPFTAEQENGAEDFVWRARVGVGPVTLLSVTDRYADGSGSMDGRLFGRARLFAARDPETVRSAAGRAALEAAVFAPAALLARDDVRWWAQSDTRVVVSWPVGPERPQVTIDLDASGAARSVSAPRRRRVGDAHAYVPCGCDIHGHRRFGDALVPSSLTVAWWYGTPRAQPFFRAELESWTPVPV